MGFGRSEKKLKAEMTKLAHKCQRFVFVTAYDHYAIRAFEVRAIDYLLKNQSTKSA